MTREAHETMGSQLVAGSWQPKDIPFLYQELELPNWAPWLAASAESLAGRALVFPVGQMVLRNETGMPLASLSMNRINWDGDPAELPTWDEVAGNPTTYEQTFVPDGNTLTMMSMNVHPDAQGSGYARKMIEQAKMLAMNLGVDNLIGSFRPNQYGKHKLEQGDQALDFASYCIARRVKDGLPVDAWLRNLTRNGMVPLKVDHNAMIVDTPLEGFACYKATYQPNDWKQTGENSWECGEVGNWTVDPTTGWATYKESNLWGIAWQRPGLR